VLEPVLDAECLKGQSEAAAQIFAEHGDFIRTVIRLQIRDTSRQDDMFQELFLKLVYEPVPSDVLNIRGYLYRTIVHDMLDMSRRQEKYQQYVEKYAEDARISIHNRPSRNAIEEVEEADEQDSRLRYMVRQLRRREAQVVILRFRDECTIAEIAERIGTHPRTVSRYLTSGLGRLRKTLAIQ